MASVRYQVLIDASQRAVWNALTTGEGVASWWATDGRIDARESGRIVLGHEHGGERVEEVGLVIRCRPTANFDVKWDSAGGSPTRGTTVQFQIGRGDGESKLHVIHSGTALEDEAFAAAMESLWKERLLKLREVLERA
jgi:uncharacterized protein YndB with AHSA1/START domain